MTEWKLFEGEVPYVSTAQFHADRERAPHLEQKFHRGRLERAAEFIGQALRSPDCWTVSDLGCGDGGLLSLVKGISESIVWGYDFAPANAAGWTERGVTAYAADAFGEDADTVVYGDVVVMTEVLEHLADPHGTLRRVRGRSRALVCSSPWNENPNSHSPEHAWAWDLDGYIRMIEDAGWTIDRHESVDLFQVVLAH